MSGKRLYPSRRILVAAWLILTSMVGSVSVIYAQSNPFSDMASGTWREIPNTKIDSVKPGPVPAGMTGHTAVLSAWNSGDYDVAGRRFVIAAAGGHADYAGNEVYSFSTQTLTWSRIKNASIGYESNLGLQGCDGPCWTAKDPYTDGTPASRHTYDGVAFLPTKNALWFFGGVIWSPGGESSIHAYWYNMATNTYTQKSNYTQQSGAQAFWDATTGKVIGRRSALYFTYDPETDTYIDRSVNDGGCGNGTSIVLDPIGRKIYRIGVSNCGKGVKVFDLSVPYNPGNPGASTETTLPTSGDTEIEGQFTQGGGPGLAWDPISRLIVAYGFTAGNANGQIYTLNPATGVWTKRAAATATLPAPPPVQGMWKKFFYVPEYDVFMVITQTLQNVWVYKPSWRVNVPQGEWVMLEMPSGALPTNYDPTGSKHVAFEFNPNNRKFYLFGGDYAGFGDSYRQAVLSFDVKARLEAGAAGRTAGWATERGDCDAGIQPKHPDFINAKWDRRRNVFWIIPGVQVASGTNCTGEIAANGDDANFKWGHIMSYDPVTKLYNTLGSALAVSPGGDQYAGIYDYPTDSIIRVHGSSTVQVSKLNLSATSTGWSTTTYGNLGFLEASPPAYDEAGRRFFVIQPYSGRLYRYNIDASTWTDLGAIPGGPTATDCQNQPYLKYNSVDNVVMFVRRRQLIADTDCNANKLATADFPQGDLQIYNPATATWTQGPRTGIDLTKGDIGRTTQIAFDPTLNMLLVFPHSLSASDSKVYFGIYRYGRTSTSTPPIVNNTVPAAPSGLALQIQNTP
jgi:hypothetical protein